MDVPRPVIASKNDKLELQDCLEFNRTAKVSGALPGPPLGDLPMGLNLGVLTPHDSLVLGFLPYTVVLSHLQIQRRRGS